MLARVGNLGVFLFSLLVIGSFTSIVFFSQPTHAVNSPKESVTFTHHYYSEIYHSENRSFFIYNGSDTQGPLRSSAFKCTFECQIKQVIQGVTVWGGLVSWLTQPLDDDLHIVGDVVLKAWMSSTDDIGPWGSSGYVMGVSEIDEGRNVTWSEYDYRYSILGKAISDIPTEYSITLNIDHVFKKGHKIGFGVGAGSTKKGWTVNVFFDSPDRNSRAIVPYEIVYIIIDQAYVSDNRVDVGSVVTVGFHAKWHNNSDVVGGRIYVNGTEHVTNGTGWVSFATEAYNDVGKRWWEVTGVSCGGVTVYKSLVDPVYCIWDKISITVLDTRMDVGSTGSYIFTAVYEFDGKDAKPHLTLRLNDTLTKNTVGKYGYTVVRISDAQYGLTAFTSNHFHIIFDRVAVTLSVRDNRIDVGASASITKSGIYEYDGTVFMGAINLNDTETKSIVGNYSYRALSINDPTYELKVFTTNVVHCIFDRIQVTITTPQERVEVGTKAPLTWTGKYEYDGATFTGEVTLSEELTKQSIGRFSYTVKSIQDPLYGLKTFVSNTVDVIFDRIVFDLQTETIIPGSVKPIVRLRYQFDNTPVVDAKVVIDGTEAINLGDGSYAHTHISTWSPYVTFNVQIDRSGFTTIRTSGSVFALGNIITIGSIIIVLALIIIAAKRGQRQTG